MAIETTKENINVLHPLNSSLNIDFNSKISLVSTYPWIPTHIHCFLMPLNLQKTREKYDRRMLIFLDFLKIPGLTMKERCIFLTEEGKKNNQWILNCIVIYILYQRNRLERKEITGSTLFNYLKSIKLFCEMRSNFRNNRILNKLSCSISLWLHVLINSHIQLQLTNRKMESFFSTDINTPPSICKSNFQI